MLGIYLIRFSFITGSTRRVRWYFRIRKLLNKHMGRVATMSLRMAPLPVIRVACTRYHVITYTNIRVCRDSCRCQSSRSSQELEAEYYKEWERLTLVPEEELNRKMTFMSFITFIPVWLRYHGLPGPLRFLLFSKNRSPSKSSVDDKAS